MRLCIYLDIAGTVQEELRTTNAIVTSCKEEVEQLAAAPTATVRKKVSCRGRRKRLDVEIKLEDQHHGQQPWGC
jgi:putative N-acetylmannosamine-6-phosphate epimerase